MQTNSQFQHTLIVKESKYVPWVAVNSLNFVNQTGQADAFNKFLDQQKQELLQQKQRLSLIEQTQLEQIKETRKSEGNRLDPYGLNSSFNYNIQAPKSSRSSFSSVANGQAGPSMKGDLSDQLEKQKRLRAFQNFLRIREHEKQHKDLLEDFGSGVMNILMLPTQMKMPKFIEQGTHMITHAFDRGQPTNQPQLQAQAESPSRSFELPRRYYNESVVTERLEGTMVLMEEQKQRQRNSSMRFTKESHLDIIVDNNESPQIYRQHNESSKEVEDEVRQDREYILGEEQQNIKDIMEDEQTMKMNKAVYALEFNYTDYLGELTLRQIQINKDKSKRIFPMYPDGNFKMSWDSLGFCFIIYQAMMIPYRFCFKSKAKDYLLYFETMIDIFWICDFFLNFVTGYYKRGTIVMRRGPIVKRYLRTWFIIDLIASFPYSWFLHESQRDYWPVQDFESKDSTPADTGSYVNNFIMSNALRILDYDTWKGRRLIGELPQAFTATSATDFSLPSLLRLLKLLRFIRIIKIFQFFKLRKFLYRYEWFFFNDTVTVLTDFAKTLLFVMFIIHWMACIFFLIADWEDDNTGELTWLNLLSPADVRSPIDVYVAALSWSFTTIATVGYGDIYAVTTTEMIFATFGMITSCGVFAYIVGFLGNVFDKNSQIIQDFQINQSLLRIQAPRKFRKEVKKYLIYLLASKRENKLDTEEVFEMLSDNLKQELIIHLNGKMLHENPPFHHFSLVFLLDITFLLKAETFSVDDKIFEEDDLGQCLYYITKGYGVHITQKKSATYVTLLGYDQFLGEIGFFSGQPRKSSAKSRAFTEVLTLWLPEFLETCEKHDGQMEKFQRIRALINKTQDYKILGVKCYLCKEEGHIAVDCSLFEKVKGNMKDQAIKRMREIELKKIHKKEREDEGQKKKDWFGESMEFDLDQSLNDSVAEMFTELEKRYKKDAVDEKQKQDSEDQKSTPKNAPKIQHFQGLNQLTEPSKAMKYKNEEFLKTNFEEIEEHSLEESILIRESIRQSIDNQIALVNKLTEIQVRPSEKDVNQSRDLQFDIGYLRQSSRMMSMRLSKKGKLPQHIDRIDEEDDDEVVMQGSTKFIDPYDTIQRDKERIPALIPVNPQRSQGGHFSALIDILQEKVDKAQEQQRQNQERVKLSDLKRNYNRKRATKLKIPQELNFESDPTGRLLEPEEEKELMYFSSQQNLNIDERKRQ